MIVFAVDISRRMMELRGTSLQCGRRTIAASAFCFRSLREIILILSVMNAGCNGRNFSIIASSS
jgi:hypothetical protein